MIRVYNLTLQREQECKQPSLENLLSIYLPFKKMQMEALTQAVY